MFRKKGPLVVFFLLIIVLIFIIGVRYGQNVERMNKVIDHILKLTPAVKPTVSAIEYKMHTVPFCGVSFLYPSNLKLDSDSSTSAGFIKESLVELQVNCAPENKLESLYADTTATASVTFQGKNTIVKKMDDLYILNFRNTKNSRIVFVLIEKKLLSLFDGSLKF